jgi:hypothetical protein
VPASAVPATAAARRQVSVNRPVKMSAATSGTSASPSPARRSSPISSATSGLGRIVCGNARSASSAASSRVRRAAAVTSGRRVRSPCTAPTHGSSSNRTWLARSSSSRLRRRRNAA